MKVRLQAGAELDLFTKKEFEEGLSKFARDWMVEVARGPKPVRWSGSGAVTSSGVLTIGGIDVNPADGGRYGPDVNLIWSIKRWGIQNLSTGDSLTAYISDANPTRFIKGGITGYDRFGSDELILLGGEKLLFHGDNLVTPSGTLVTVSGSAWELPAQLAYRLM